MRVFITGGAGFIGSYIARELLKEKDEVILHDAFLSYVSPLTINYNKLLKYRLDDIKDKVTLIRGDVRHKGRLLRILKEQKPDAVIHLAALPIAQASNEFSEDSVGINLNGTINVLESVREIQSVKRFIFASSSFIYGDFKYSPADENHPTDPIDVYGATKLSGEIFTRAYGKRFGIEYTIIRPSAVYGPTDANMRVSQIFVENALKGIPLVLHEGGLSRLDFTFVEDAAKGFVLALKSEKAKNEIFNITRGEGRSIKEFAEILQKLIPNVKTIEKPSTEKRPERGTLDISKAKKLLGYEPKYSLEEGTKKYVEFVKKVGLDG